MQLWDAEERRIIESDRVEGMKDERIFDVIDRASKIVRGWLSQSSVRASDVEDRHVADITTSSEAAIRAYVAGVDYYNRFLEPQAINAFEQAIIHDSTFAMAHFYLARLGREHHIYLAIQNADAASQADQLLIRSQAAWHEGRYEEAVTLMKEVADDVPDDKELLYQLGILLAAMKQHERSLEYLDSDVVVDPHCGLAYNQMAYVYSELDDVGRMIWALDKYVESAPKDPNAYDSRGGLFAARGMLDEAIESYQRALEIDSTFPASLMNLGFMLMFAGDYGGADEAISTFTSLGYPKFRSAGLLYHAHPCLYQGKFDEAVERLDQGISVDLNSDNLAEAGTKMQLRSLVLSEIGKCGEAAQSMRERIKSTDMVRVGDWHIDIQILMKCGLLDEASELMELARTSTDTTSSGFRSRYLYVKGCEAWQKGDPESALIQFQASEELIPSLPAQYWLGRSFLLTGNLGNAKEQFQKILSNYGSYRAYFALWSIKTHYYLGMTYELSGWKSHAIEQYEFLLARWQNADHILEEVEDARLRLAALNSAS
jgi:tetratricopeptide (TPR) repeat protein